MSDLQEIKDDVKEILRRLGTGDVSFENMRVRLDHIEKVVYGALWIGIIALIGMFLNIITAIFLFAKGFK